MSKVSTESPTPRIISTGPAQGILPVEGRTPITVIGTNAIRAGFDAKCLQQAINVHADYFERFNSGEEHPEILRHLKESFSYVLRDKDDAPSFWLAVAKAQWECGFIDSSVVQAVVATAHSTDALERWHEAGSGAVLRRKRAIDQFLQKISRPNPKPKKRRKPILRKPIYSPGDCLALALEDGEWGAALVLASPNEEIRPGRDIYGRNVIGVLNYKSKRRPTESVFRARNWLRLTHHNWKGRARIVNVIALGHRAMESRLVNVGNIPLQADDPRQSSSFVSWGSLGRQVVLQYEWDARRDSPEEPPVTAEKQP